MKSVSLAPRPNNHPKYKWVLNLRPFGKGRKFFRFRAEAEAEALREKTALARHGREAIALPQHELSVFIEGRRKLAEYGKRVADAIDFYVNHLERTIGCKVTVAQLSEEIIKAKVKDGYSQRHIKDLKQRLGRFCRDFGNEPVASVTREKIDNWLRDLELSAQSRRNYRAIVGILFSEAERRELIERNPVTRTARPKLIEKPVEILSVDETRALLEAASRVAPDMVPAFAIGAFAGLRESEIARLEWKEIDLTRGFVHVTAAKSKSARRRLVPIQNNLIQWLAPYSGMSGQVVPASARKKVLRVRAEAGLTRWPPNALRHSFASYHLAHFKNAAETALQLGHSNATMLWQHYRELVRPEEAERYWKIASAAEVENVVAFSK